MSIIISKEGQNAQKLDKSDFEKEDYLQDYIHKNPEAIPVYEIEENKKLFVVKREFETSSGPIDALAVDKDGDIYIVETKLYKNPDKRTVVAQALDYGASLWKHLNDFSEFMNILDNECQKNFNQAFKEKISEFFELQEEQAEIQLDAMKRNLADGNLKFVILMDSIDERLKDLIIYVNQNSQFDIYAVQLEYYKFNEYEIMIPKIFGVEVKKNIKSTSIGGRKQWNETDFIQQTRNSAKDNESKVIELYNYFKKKADKISWGTGKVNGSYAPMLNKISSTISPFSFYSDGKIMIKLNWLKSSLGQERVEMFADYLQKELRDKTSIGISKDELLNREPSISSEDFDREYEGLVRAIKNFIQEFNG